MQVKKARISKKNAGAGSPLWENAEQVLRQLRAAGHAAYFAGGCVRDFLLGRPLHDVDIATAAPPAEVAALFTRTVSIGKAFGVVRVLHGGFAYDVATFRSESGYRDGRHPDRIAATDVRGDVLRRDFTVNGMMLDPFNGEVWDFVHGLEDLEKKIIRSIGDPARRFEEDRLRMLRAVRFSASLGFAIESRTADAVRAWAGRMQGVSLERIGEEMTRILAEALRPGDAVRQLSDLGLLAGIMPEVERMKSTLQPPRYHPEGDVFEHTVGMLNALPPPPRDPELAFAVLLHDVGKPPTLEQGDPSDPDSRRFPNHAVVGEALCREILARLKRPSALVNGVAAMTRRHMTFRDAPRMRESRLRRFMGGENFARELELHRLDCRFSHGDLSIHAFLEKKLAERSAEPMLPPPWIRGRDLLSLGLRPGPAVGRWLREAYDAQIEGRFRDRKALLAWLKDRVQADLPPEGNSA